MTMSVSLGILLCYFISEFPCLCAPTPGLSFCFCPLWKRRSSVKKEDGKEVGGGETIVRVVE